jgi:DNA transformation protein and related proteins
VGEANKGEYLDRGMPPFRPNDRQTLKSYYQAPPDVIADPDTLLSWVEGAIRVGQEPQDPGTKK